MNRSEPAARCYAEALLLLARERKRLEPILDDLRGVMGALHGDRRLWGLFTSPRIDREEKEALIRKAFTGRVGEEVLGLLVVMVRKGREALYDNVVDQFARFKDLEEKRLHVHVRSARGLDGDVKAAIEAALAGTSGKNVVLHEERDPSLLGGLVVRVGDTVVDGSLRSRLRTLGSRLLGERR